MTRKNHRWTEKQLDYIREKYPTTPAKVLAAELGVTYCSIAKTITQYQIKKKVHIHTWVKDECKVCGIRRKKAFVWAYSCDNFNTRQIDTVPKCSRIEN